MRLVALAIVVVGCAHHPTARLDPQLTLHAWSEAIAHNDPHTAYALLSSSLKSRLSESDFTLQWKAAPAELSEQQDGVRTATVNRQAAVHQRDGRALVLARENGLWRLAGPRPSDEGAETPEEALRRLIDALDARDFDALLRVLAEPLRSSIEQALSDRLEKLRASVKKGGIEASGDHARIRYDSRYHIDLIQENGRWRVRDFN
jgi:hypothetical protein